MQPGPRKSDDSKSWAVLHRTSARCVLNTTSHLRGRPASRSSRYLGWKQFVAVVEQLVYVRAKSEFSRRKVRNKGGTTIGRRCLTLRDRGFMAGRGRVSRCSLPLEARGLESRSPFCPATSRLRSSDPKVSSLSMPDDKAARTLGSRERGREVAGPERPVQTLPHTQRVC